MEKNDLRSLRDEWVNHSGDEDVRKIKGVRGRLSVYKVVKKILVEVGSS